MADTTEYLALVTSEHADAPAFTAGVAALTAGFADIRDALRALPGRFDLDSAVGDQLDAVGAWAGISRVVRVAITGVYFAWDDTASDGWEVGVWKADDDPTSGPYSVDDDTYRVMIRCKIAANMWDGTYEGMCGFFDYAFGAGVVKPQDNQDMSITLLYDDLQMNSVTKALLLGGVFPLKPMGVRLIYQAATGNPIFAWDTNTPRFQGWTGTSVWV